VGEVAAQGGSTGQQAVDAERADHPRQQCQQNQGLLPGRRNV